MSKVFYKVTRTLSFESPETVIKEVVVIKETSKTVTSEKYGREYKNSHYAKYFESRDKAVEYVLRKKKIAFESALDKVDKAQKSLEQYQNYFGT